VTTVPRDKEDYDDQLITHYAEVDPALRVAESRRGMYRRFLNEIEYRRKQGSRLLDIGCGKGYFPVQAKARGWEAEGVDIVPDLIDQGREEFGVQLHCGDFTEIDISHN
jgi:ubiquinone/menaquinone biosynthesis C-methylase UbiE